MHALSKLTPRHALAAAAGTLALMASLSAAAAPATAADVVAAKPAQAWAPGRLLIQSRAGLADAQVDQLVKAHGGKARRLGHSDLHVVDLPQGVSEASVRELLATHPQLKFAELDRRVPHDMVANDGYLGSQWHLPKISAPVAWDSSQGSGITIAILDSGVLPTHPDLAPKLVAGWNFYDNNANTADVNGHGTAVAGSAAAMTNNGLGVAGVAGAAKIMPLRVSDSSGYAYYSTIAQAVTYAADHGARVANASFSAVYSSAAVQSAAQYLKSKGGLLVVSAGNSAANDGSPASSAMIPVSATDANDARASWSSYGNYVAVAAPGVGIWTTAADGSYRAASGTSFSAPITAGVIALMMAAKPTLTAAQVEGLLYASATDLGAAGRDIYFGYGRVNAAAAVAAAAGGATPDTQAPSASISAPLGSSSVSGLVAVNVAAADNVGVTKVELRVNGSTVATDTTAPYQFSWDTSKLANGSASLVAVAYDAAGNSTASAPVSVNIANTLADTTAPVLRIGNPVNGSTAIGFVTIDVSATDDRGSAGIRQSLYIDGKLRATATGGSLSYTWNSRVETAGMHSILAVASDAAGNAATTTVVVNR